MSLLNTENKTVSASFEDDDSLMANAVPAAETVQVAASVPAVPTAKSLAIAALHNPLDVLKNALRVEYNTLESIIVTQGNFKSRETKKVLGDEVQFEVLSFQDSFVVSPNDDKAPTEVLRYSDDGLTCSDGTAVAEHIHWLKTNGYPKASLKQRTVVVGAIEKASKGADFVGTLVQFDLSPVSRVHWNRYMANAAFMVRAGRCTPEQLTKVKATAENAVNGTNDYTYSKFAVAD